MSNTVPVRLSHNAGVVTIPVHHEDIASRVQRLKMAERTAVALMNGGAVINARPPSTLKGREKIALATYSPDGPLPTLEALQRLHQEGCTLGSIEQLLELMENAPGSKFLPAKGQVVLAFGDVHSSGWVVSLVGHDDPSHRIITFGPQMPAAGLVNG